MSLVMAIVCTDGIVVSGDFRKTEFKMNPQTGEKRIVGFSDNTHKLVRTKSNRIVGHTGNTMLNDGRDIDSAIQETLFLTETLGLSLFDEFVHLVGCIGTSQNAIIEAGIENGKKFVFIWRKGDANISFNHTGGSIGDTDALEKYKPILEEKQKSITVDEAKKLLQEYNQLVANETPTISPECETMVIKPTNLNQ